MTYSMGKLRRMCSSAGWCGYALWGSDADILIGSGGADFFVLAAGQGLDTITDYRLAQEDVLGLVDGISVEFTQADGNTLVTLAGTSELLAVLTGVEDTPIVAVTPPVI